MRPNVNCEVQFLTGQFYKFLFGLNIVNVHVEVSDVAVVGEGASRSTLSWFFVLFEIDPEI